MALLSVNPQNKNLDTSIYEYFNQLKRETLLDSIESYSEKLDKYMEFLSNNENKSSNKGYGR